ncbi:hypothetical protein CUMW_032100 [Citrus unshiu]|nr:hypothetical protein CUMW_032100 [Citrus unshiu]
MPNLESYPPVFRRKHNDFDPDESVQDFQECYHSDPVPSLDLGSLNLEKLGDACRNWGLFRLVSHGIPETLMSQLRSQAKNLFSFSFETKQRLFTNKPAAVSIYFWGTPALTPSGAALARAPQSINWVEGFNVPLTQLSDRNQYFQGQQDPLFDSFRLSLEEYGKHMSRIARTIFEAMVRNLHLDSTQSHSDLSESTGLVRVYRYPKFSKADEALGMEVHTDSSVLSILNEDQVGGLEVFKDDKWLLVQPIPGSLIVNLGDMMQAISNDEYMSVMHRVKVNKNEERHSVCYFVFPGEGSVIRSSRYKPFTYSDFQARVQHDIKTLGFKVGLQRFKISEDA